MINNPTNPNDPSREIIIPNLTSSTLDSLYNAINKAAKCEPWADFSGVALIAIHDQASDQTYIIQFYEDDEEDTDGMNIYLPEEGLRVITSLHLRGSFDNILGTYVNHMLSVELVPARSYEVDPIDRQRKKDHLPKPSHLRGKRIPLPRVVRPGEASLQVDEKEAALLTRILQTIPTIYKRQDKIFDIFKTDATPCLTLNPDGKVIDLKGIPFPDPGPAPLPDASLDDLTIEKLSHLKVQKNTLWECGSVFLEMLQVTDGRPCHLSLALCADLKTRTTSDPHIGLVRDHRHHQIIGTFVNLAEKQGRLPAAVQTNHPVTFNSLRELTKSHGIKVDLLPQPSPPMMSLYQPRVLEARDGGSPHPEAPENLPNPQDVANALKAKLGTNELPNDLMQALQQMLGTPVPSRPSPQKGTGVPPGEIPSYQKPTSPDSYVLRVDLMQMKPPIWRRVAIPTDATFFDLHRLIQAAFGWFGYHLHAFQIENVPGHDSLSWRGSANEYPSAFRSDSAETTVTLAKIFNTTAARIYYDYDFGDGWRHRIKLEKTIPTDPSQPLAILKGKGHILEDCGGPYGLREIIKGTHPHCQEIHPELLQDIQSGTFDPRKTLLTPIKEEMERQDEMNE